MSIQNMLLMSILIIQPLVCSLIFGCMNLNIWATEYDRIGNSRAYLSEENFDSYIIAEIVAVKCIII